MKGMTLIVKTVSSWVKILIFLFGLYLILFGDVSPGGGFAGGVILASVYVLLMLAFGREFVERNLPPAWSLKLLCLGALLFAGIAISGLFCGSDGFLWNFTYQKYLADKAVHTHFMETGNSVLAEFAIGLIVCTALFLVIYTLSSCCKDIKSDGAAEEKE